jgi:hypothetical protein
MQINLQNFYKLIKSTIIKLFPSKKGQHQRTFRFYKEHSGRWYVDLPEWKAAKWHLEMVAGADQLLESLRSADRNDVVVFVSLKETECDVELTKYNDDSHGDGADYTFYDETDSDTKFVWLCGVTEWYYGFMPEKIFIRKIA